MNVPALPNRNEPKSNHVTSRFMSGETYVRMSYSDWLWGWCQVVRNSQVYPFNHGNYHGYNHRSVTVQDARCRYKSVLSRSGHGAEAY